MCIRDRIRTLNIPADMVLYSEHSNHNELILQTVQLIKSRDQKDLKLIKNTLDNLIENLDEYKNI